MIESYPKFRYFVPTERGVRELWPKGDHNFIYELQREKQMYFYRLILDGELIFQNDNREGRSDYDFLKGLEDEVEVEFLIKRYCSGSYSTFWEGYLDLTQEWDDDAGILKTSAITEDDYSNFVRDLDKEFDIFSIGLTRVTVTDNNPNPELGGSVAYSNGVYLDDVISYMVLDLLNTDYASNFFQDTNNPITGTTNYAKDLVLFRKSDVIDSTTKSSKGLLTFQTVIDWVRIMFNVYPYIDSGGDFRFEHRKYFDNNLDYSSARSVGIDLTSATYEDLIRDKNKYNYDPSRIFKKESYSYQEADDVSFRIKDITYSQLKTKENTKENTCNNLNVDIDFIQYKPDEISTEGFVLMSHASNILKIFDVPYETQAININITESAYDTLILDGTTNIEEATNAVGNNYIFISCELLRNVSSGDSFVLTFDFTNNGGTYPTISLTQYVTVKSNVEYIIDGENNITLYANADINEDDGELIFEIRNPDGAVDFSMLDIKIVRNPRANVKNGYLSWINLLNAFHTYGRPLPSGQIGGVTKTFDSQDQVKTGEEIKNYPVCCTSFDEEKLVRTDIGDGRILKAVLNKDLIMELTLIY